MEPWQILAIVVSFVKEWWTILTSLGVGGVAGRFLTIWWEKYKLEREHKLRIIEEHTKKLHEYVKQYYLPVSHRAYWVAESLEKIEKQKSGKTTAQELEEALQLSFFDLARFLSSIYQWGRKADHILMLENRTAEWLLSLLMKKIHSQLVASNGFITLEDEGILRKEISPNELFSDFKDKFGKEPLKGIFSRYKSQIDKKDAQGVGSIVKMFQCYHTLFLFEINCCYDAWYGRATVKPKPKIIEDVDVEGVLKELENDENISKKDRKDYLKRIRKNSWCQAKQKLACLVSGE